jgi:tetratricopeptide (TPR) repeat protein
MSFKTILVAGLCLVIVLAVGIPLFLNYLNVEKVNAEHRTLIEEGFQLLDEAKVLLQDDQDAAMGILDEVITKGRAARELIPEGEEVSLLLGRTYYLKEDFTRSITELEKGFKYFDDIDFLPELHYHIAVAYTSLYSKLNQKEKFEEALANFSKVASTTPCYHKVDAYFGIAMLYLIRFRQSMTVGDREKLTMNFRRALQLEAGVEGYVEGEPGSSCPLCRMTFTKKSDDPSITAIRESLENQ